VYANADLPDGFGSSPNAISVCDTRFSDFSEGREGAVHATFALDALRICIDAIPTRSSDVAVLRSYDANDTLLGELFSSPGIPGRLCLDGSGIRGVRFAGFEDGYARFDDLIAYTSPESPESPGTGVPSAVVTFVPEPSSWLLSTSALAVLAIGSTIVSTFSQNGVRRKSSTV
jgi:hypothetical protein